MEVLSVRKMTVCVCACVRACVRARARSRARVRVHVCIIHPDVCECEWVSVQVCVRVGVIFRDYCFSTQNVAM